MRISRKTVKYRDVYLQDLSPEQHADLRRLLALAMRLATHIEHMMPNDKDAAVPENGLVKPLPLEFDRLLGPNDGVIDSFDRLVKIVIRIIDKERETIEPPILNCVRASRLDAAELDRRIARELDFIADQRRISRVP
jgi:hypothetical protein